MFPGRPAITPQIAMKPATLCFVFDPGFVRSAYVRLCVDSERSVSSLVLAQSLVEHLLVAFLHAALLHSVPPKVQYPRYRKKMQELGLLTDRDATDLTRLSELRNPLTRFRHFDDTNQLDRRGAEAKGLY